MAGPEDPVLADNPVTDPMVAGVGRNAPLAAIAPPGATQADRAVEPMGIGPTRNSNLIFLGSPLCAASRLGIL